MYAAYIERCLLIIKKTTSNSKACNVRSDRCAKMCLKHQKAFRANHKFKIGQENICLLQLWTNYANASSHN